MLTRDDLIDLIIETVGRHIKPLKNLDLPRGESRSEAGVSGKEQAAPRGRLFLSEYDIRQRLTPDGKRLTIPRDAIISPLASDWIVLRGIEVVRE